MSEHILPIRVYVYTFLALMALMGLTAYLSTVPMGHDINTFVALLIAAIKATLVLLFFMHLKYESYVISTVVFIAGLFWLIIFFGLTIIDYGTRMKLGIPGH
jgi:cytochrome c oxidase subunit 4